MSSRSIASFQRRVLAWYALNGRDFPWRAAGADVYVKIMAEVLLQQTTARSVAAFLPRFRRRYPSWNRLAEAPISTLEADLKPLGLWRRRARSLSALSQEMVRRHGRYPRTRDVLESMPAVGQYVASAVLLFRFGESEPLLDAGMARVIGRYFGVKVLADIRCDTYLQRLARRTIRGPASVPMNWAILDLAAAYCRPRHPSCGGCPVRRGCKGKTPPHVRSRSALT